MTDVPAGTLYRKGLGLREKVKEPLDKDYKGLIVDYAREHGYHLVAGEISLRLAKEFGFCYGVDRAVEYAYEARTRFPNKIIYITGEIIHNPFVNRRLQEMGVRFLKGSYGTLEKFAPVTSDDVILLPAFGVSTEELGILEGKGSILVDTTCGSVMNVWKNVERYARTGFTSIVHGKYWHEETKATVSRATQFKDGHYLVLRDMEETSAICQYIEGNGVASELEKRFRAATSSGFNPDRHLQRIGLANQTTMLSSESLAIGEELRKSILRRYGEKDLESRFLAFDTICSATQERQDAVIELCDEGVDLMLVIGGYNSSNTTHLAEICSPHFPTFHIADADCLLSKAELRHKPVESKDEVLAQNWFPNGPLKVGITAGASTPDVKVDESIARLLSFRGLRRQDLRPAN